MLVRLLANLFINPINIPLRLLGKLLLNPINIPLRCFAFAARRCSPSKGELLELCLDLIILSKSMK